MSLDDLVARARLESGLRANAYYADDQIIRYLDAGGAELADIFTQANQHYVIKEFDFTTTGPSSAIVTLPTDFQQGHSLEIFPASPGQTRTIRFLPNWLNRNAYVGNAFTLAPGGFDPCYTFLGTELRFYPPQCTPAAPFRLYYTPQWTTLAAKSTLTFTIDPASSKIGSTPLEFNFPGAGFTTDMVGGTITLAFTDGFNNGPFNGTYTVLAILSSTDVQTSGSSGASFHNPSSGSGTVVWQPAGTTDTLPTVMVPWSEYLVVYAAIAINTDRQRGTGELERKLQALKVRIASTIGQRQEEPQQPPLTRGTFGGGAGWGGGGFGGWW